MSLDGKFYHGEDTDITKAVQKCAQLIYEAFKKFKHRGKTFLHAKFTVTSYLAIPTFKKAATGLLEETSRMEIAVAKDKRMLMKFRPYIENEPLILVDLEGDQLGPRGEITFIQINTFKNERCYLIDILEIGNDELKNEDGWLR